MKSIKQKLAERLRMEIDSTIPENELPRRLYTGGNQRASGAWSWIIGATVNMSVSYGSNYTMQEILKSSKIATRFDNSGEIAVIPD